MQLSTAFAGVRARLLACGLSVGVAFAVHGCQSAPQVLVQAPRPAVLVMENLGHCAWRINAKSAERSSHAVTVPVGETVRLERPSGTYEITQEALAGLDAQESMRRFMMPLAAGETYHWRLATLATVSGDLLR